MTGSPHSRSPDDHQGRTAGKRWFAGRPPLKSTPNVWATRKDVYRAKLVFYLFLVSLGVFFVASLASYCIIRLQAFHPVRKEYLPLVIPVGFLYSTIALVFVSGFLQTAVRCIRRKQQEMFRLLLILSWIAAGVFLLIQYSGMESLLDSHFQRTDGSSKAYGLCFTLAFLHALHVLGGMFFLGFIILRGFTLGYDHEHHYAVEHCAAYWHFLDAVWLTMLATFWITRQV